MDVLKIRIASQATFFWLMLLLSVGGYSINVWATPAVIPAVTEQKPLVFPTDKTGRPSYLRQISVKFDPEPGKMIGELQSGWFCSYQADIYWNKKSYPVLIPTNMLVSMFRQQLESARFPVLQAQKGDSIFEANKPKNEEIEKNALHVGVLVKEIALNLCPQLQEGSVQGGAYLKLYWEVFAPEQQKVIFSTTTEGSFQSPASIKGPPTLLVANAFAMASRNLLAQQGFLQAISNAAPNAVGVTAEPGNNSDNASTPTPFGSKLLVDNVRGSEEALSQKVTSLRSAVATIYGDVGSGTGFFIGKNGMMLSNKHVVGNAKFVKVRLATGRDLVGEVLRAQSSRDVVLIKTEPAGITPIAIRASDPAIGEDVFALGSPLGDAFNSTLTKGILGGYRTINNQRFLQSDVAILPGNSGGPLLDKSGQVIGITVMGLGAKGLAGMNFFIPINEALELLSLQLSLK